MATAGLAQGLDMSFDVRGHEPAQFDVMAFPGEEPPQIECNEDAAGESTEE